MGMEFISIHILHEQNINHLLTFNDLLYSTLIWRSFILAIGNLRSKSPLLKPPIINAHAHSNTLV